MSFDASPYLTFALSSSNLLAFSSSAVLSPSTNFLLLWASTKAPTPAPKRPKAPPVATAEGTAFSAASSASSGVGRTGSCVKETLPLCLLYRVQIALATFWTGQHWVTEAIHLPAFSFDTAFLLLLGWLGWHCYGEHNRSRMLIDMMIDTDQSQVTSGGSDFISGWRLSKQPCKKTHIQMART